MGTCIDCLLLLVENSLFRRRRVENCIIGKLFRGSFDERLF
ncbi:hypothetical protein HMPREF1982_04103 [Clostridiales bacterium oral taxon 876 str. F0540]|nr:hypothetical protein HMPREF1982_04103 [Clostridiales bacterium oral taxon 876 str. F0540]